MELYKKLTDADKTYIDHIRGALILRVVMMHLGLAWFYLPYSSYFALFFPALFCVSGIVSYYSYRRAQGVVHYLIKRLMRIVVTFYVISGLAYLVVFAIDPHIFNVYELINWLLINPETVAQPYPMGQIWFLRSLVILAVLVVPFFYLSTLNIHYLLIPVVISVVLAVVQQLTDVGKDFILSVSGFNELNLYQPLVNMGYFCFGAWACYSGALQRRFWMIALAVTGVLAAFGIYQYQRFSLNLSDHSYNQDFFYLSLGYVGIGLIFGLRKQLALVIRRIKLLDTALAFFSFHAFSIFMIHSFYIYFAEYFFGLKGMGSVTDIFLKIVFVLVASCVSAVPLSYISKKITNWLVAYIDSRPLVKEEYSPK